MSIGKVKELGIGVAGFIFFGLFLFVTIWLIKGVVWVGDYVYPIVQFVTNIALTIAFLICLPLSIFKKFRFYCAIGIAFASFIAGFDLWVHSLITTYVIWGWIGVLFGFITGVIGMIPVSLIALMIDGQWTHFWAGIFALMIIFILFALSLFIGSKAEE